MVEIWENMFLKIADAHAPIRTRRVRNKKSPWNTTELRELITGRNRQTSATEVFKLLGKLSPNKATGLDNIPCRLLKEAGPIIATSHMKLKGYKYSL